jgi:hypothetical protein
MVALIARLSTIQPIKQQTKLPDSITNLVRISAAAACGLHDVAHGMRQSESRIDR